MQRKADEALALEMARMKREEDALIRQCRDKDLARKRVVNQHEEDHYQQLERLAEKQKQEREEREKKSIDDHYIYMNEREDHQRKHIADAEALKKELEAKKIEKQLAWDEEMRQERERHAREAEVARIAREPQVKALEQERIRCEKELERMRGHK